MAMIKCPGCDLELDEDDLRGQAEHMGASHFNIIYERVTESARWDGWEND